MSSLTSSINQNLPFVAVGCCVVLAGILLHRIARILCTSLISGIFYIDASQIKSPLKQFAHRGLIGHALQFVVLVINSLLRLVVTAFRVTFLIAYGLLPFVMLAMALAIIQQRWSETMLVLVEVFNGPFGNSLKMIVIYPLSLLQAIGIYLIPIYNLFVFILWQVPLQMLMWILKGSGSSNIMAGLKCIGDAAPLLATGVKTYVDANAVSCETSRAFCTNVSYGGTLCSDIDLGSAAMICLDPIRRELALGPPLQKLQMASSHFLIAVGTTCEALGLISKVICFPLTDPSFWNAIDRFINAVLQVVVGATSTAIQRCKLSGGFTTRPSMCTPDFGPAFRLFAISAENLGTAITHWIDVLYLFIFNQQDIQSTCSYDADLVAVWQDSVLKRMFGSNVTVLIRVSQSTFALSDGNSVVYVRDKVGQVTRTYAPLAWPTPVNPQYGIARVLLPGGVDVQDGGTGLMGCTCDDAMPSLLQCHIITRNGNVWVLPVKWSLSSETQLLTCSRLRISVQSIRWPQQRVVGSQLSLSSSPTCIDSSTCLVGDVAIYAIPVCGSSDGVKAMACFPEKTFTRGICFPYCMAVHMQHEGLQPLTMRGAAEWEQGVIIAKRDCVPITSTTNSPSSAVIQTICSVSMDSAAKSLPVDIHSASESQCSYDFTCTTSITNKSTMSGYRKESHVVPYITSSSGGVRLVLDGQPLALAAGIQMRMYKSIADNDKLFVDFPTLVGNQYNEFTVEPNSPVGIPVVTSAPVLSKGPDYERPGFMYQPPINIDRNIPYNPATVSLEALWYAVNPSYEWATALINYCASKGTIADTQIMMLSSYQPMRLWRIRYQDGGCFISSQGGHVCSPDVALASAIDSSRDIPVMDSVDVEKSNKLHDFCASGQHFNLWVESLEDFDELNIVVAVRRGNLSNIATILSQEAGGETVYYFVNKSNVLMIQESVPWKRPVADAFDLSCPALRVLPDFGAVIGHSLAAVFYLFKTPVNFVLNPFAISELLTARSLNQCPENSLLHSALNDCGMTLLSFSDLFQSIYKSNHATWDIISWLSSVIAPSSFSQSSTSQEAEAFHSFLQGASVVADATKTVTLFDVVRVVEGMDTGIQQAVLGGRRRLLSVGMSFLAHSAIQVKNGHKAVFSLTKMVGSAVMGAPFAGADIGMLLASQDPTVQLIGSAVSAPPIAWAHFTYETCVPIVLDILAAAQQGKFSFAPLWVNIYQSAGLYDDLIEKRHHQACMGFRLMLGYSSALGKGVYYNCMAGADMARGLLTVALVVLVDIPIYRCMCVRAAGQDYISFVAEECMSIVPSSRKAFWQRTTTAASSMDGVQLMCQAYLHGIEQQTFGAFDSWTSNAELSAEFLATFLDEVLVPSSAHKQSCSNIVTNPTAMVLTPMPSSHYHVCAKTTTCRLRCADSLQLFEFELNRLQTVGYAVHVPQNTFDVSVESPMFNRYASSATTINSDLIIAISSKRANETSITSSCYLRCGKESRCLSTLIQKSMPPQMFQVQYFCIPQASMILSTVFSTGLDSFVLSQVDDLIVNEGVTVTNAEFSLQNDTTYIVMCISRPSIAKSLSGETTKIVSHEIRILKPDGYGGSISQTALTSADLASDMLNYDMQQALFGGEVLNPQITGCSITSIIELASGQPGKLVFFLSFSAQIKVWTSSSGSNPDLSMQGYSIHAILHWCDGTCTSDTVYYAPCPVGCTSSECQVICNPGLDAAISLSRQGTFLYVEKDQYLFLPSSPSQSAGFVTMDPVNGLTLAHKTSKSLYFSTILNLAQLAQNQAILGSWTRSDAFSPIPALSKPVRDIKTHGGSGVIPYFFQTTGGALSTEWLQEVRAIRQSGGWMLKLYKSQSVNQSMPLNINCTHTTCSGCASARLRLLCHAAQDCALSKCVGTVVQTRNVLCGIGNVMQQSSTHAILTWRAIYMSMAEIGLLVMRGLSGDILKTISLKFPTDQFYTLVCSCKDMYASVVGLATSVCQMLTSSLNAGGGLDLTGKQDVGALVGESTLKATSLAGLAFNAISGSTLLPTLAMHRWLICMANSSFAQIEGEDGSISIQFGDVAMDKSWLPCARIGGLSEILNAGNIQDSLGTAIEMFVSFTLSLMSGIGETLLYGLQLSFDSSIDFFIGLVWSLQDILYTFNLRACKVPNNAMRYVMWCSCNDNAYRIPDSQRAHGIENGGLWCVGTLSMPASDGTSTIIYNPYTMQELSNGVSGIVAYIECLSSSDSPTSCTSSAPNLLKALIDQGIEPIAVWAKCKSNYLQSTWDIGSGVMFMTNVVVDTPHLTQKMRQAAIDWAQNKIGLDFLQCMQEPSRLQIDYSSCMRIYFDVSQQKTPNSYFLYDKAAIDQPEPPDACLVFSGLNRSAGIGSPLQTLMNDCSMQEGVGHTASCDLNPLVWSGNKPNKVAAASLHGTLPPPTLTNQPNNAANDLYKIVIQNLNRAFEAFNASFESESHFVDVALFSADGDFIHDFFDCVFLGPYTRVDVLPCDREEILNCPFYARDDLDGTSRNFTPCFGDIMYNDHRLPFTCGSQARRSIIKYFFRNYSKTTSGKIIAANISKTILEVVESIYKNYTSPGSTGCLDKKTGLCHLSACTFLDNGYAPCMQTVYEIPSEKVGEFVIENILYEVDSYYQYTMQETLPWTLYYNMSGDPKNPKHTSFPFQWASGVSAATAAKISHFAPDIPLTTYTETYSMPLPDAPSNKRTLGSLWGTCMALLSQAAMTIPLEKDSINYDEYLPVGARKMFQNKNIDMSDLNQVEMLVRNITYQASKSNSPFHWHKARRHAPSQSKVCKKKKPRYSSPHVQGRLKVGAASIIAGNEPFTIRNAEGLSFPLFGFLNFPIGEAHDSCVCSFNHYQSTTRCMISAETCSSFFNVSKGEPICKTMADICRLSQGVYDRQNAGLILDCLQTISGVRCPELGPSDLWGLYPVDCTDRECDTASSWVGTGSGDALMEGARFLNEGRAGLRLPNYKHVNATYHKAIHYGEQSKKASDMQQPDCFEIPELAPSKSQEDEADLLISDFINRLFPASQLVFDSPAVSVCSRYIIEVARAEALKFVSPSSAQAAVLQVAAWKSKCEAKLRHLSMCNMNGIFYNVPPPPNWAQLAAENGCKITLSLPKRDLKSKIGDDVYLTPWCVLVDRLQQKMYDANLCAHLARKTNILSDWNMDISDQCALNPQPLSLIKGESPYSMLFSTKNRLVKDDWLSDLSLDFDLSRVEAQSSSDNDHISHVLDWWPDELAAMPPGYHPTASSDLSELAPSLFDSHYMYDPDLHVAHYVHTAARNSSLVFNVAGASGLCRSTSVTMPMFETNTNRVCSQMAKSASSDTPTMPIQVPKQTEVEFEKELCASTEFEVPWKIKETDPQSNSAGGIPGWQEYVSMDSQGRTIYAFDSYPPPSYELSDLHSLHHGWGPCTVKWGVASPCMLLKQDCQMGVSTCLPLSENNSQSEGICFSTVAFKNSIMHGSQQVRQPCFNTFHCPDGMVCLADGGCSPLFLHVWNDAANKWPFEFTVLADSCGFKEKHHPYTQSSRGASPWEHVPDILHSHGMCSHHNWFSYRHSIRTKLCPIHDMQTMSCPSEDTDWPWIFERFDFERTTASRQSMSQGKMLLVQPHPCDDRFMHLQTPQGKRMEICSGYQGHQLLVNTNSYLSYFLQDSESWTNVMPNTGTGQNSSISRWMRTYEETTGNINIGIIENGLESDVPLGFLGANKLADDVVGDMAFGSERIHFFRCSDRVSCSNPPFTYNGVPVERLDPQTNTLNFTETSLRKCGAIGYLPSWSSQFCVLDIALFPLFSQILWGDEISQISGCGALWSKREFLTGNNFVVLLDQVDDYNIISTLAPQSLICETRLSGKCVYASRTSSRLTSLNTQDSVAIITSNLNKLLKSAGDVVLDAVKSGKSATRVYEYINKCAAMLMEKLLTTQAVIQPIYGTMGPSGLYFSFKLTLYEIPLNWLHHAMLITLLSTVDKLVEAPILSDKMGLGKIPLLLWEDRSICSKSEELDAKPVLWRIICTNSHPTYTFSIQEPGLLADKLSLKIQTQTQSDIQNKLLVNNGEMKVYCFKKASWDCDSLDTSGTYACKKAMIVAHNTTACQDFIIKENQMWQDPCANPEQFRLDDKVQVSLDQLSQKMGSGPSKDLNKFLYDTKQGLLQAAESVAYPIDYIAAASWADVTTKVNQLPIVKVWPLQPAAIRKVTSSGFNLDQWLRQDVCNSNYPSESFCVDQKDRTSLSDPCLYPWQTTLDETNRYLLDSEMSGFTGPDVILTYSGGRTQSINVCDMMSDNLGADICAVQYLGDISSFTADTSSGNPSSQTISCDIVSISAPPGVQIQAFALSLNYANWDKLLNESLLSPLKACSASGDPSTEINSNLISSCTWKSNGMDQPTPNAWWMNGTVDPKAETAEDDVYISFLNGYGPFNQPFDDMQSWWPSDKSLWKSDGCGNFPGVCSVRIRLENVRGISQGICTKASSGSTPYCGNIMNNEFYDRHSILQNKGGYNLDRCGPCTKKASTISSDGLFGCFISDDNGLSSEEILTQKSIEKSVQYLNDAIMLATMLGEDVVSHKMLNGSSLDITATLSPSSNPGTRESLLNWGKLATSTTQQQPNDCSITTPSGCWTGYDSIHSSTSDLIIWNKAIANPNTQFTMTCKAQPYTEKDFQECNPKLDKRRKSLADFVDSQYRSKNGMWMQTVDPGMGMAWQANVAHSSVGMFTIMHASTNRKETEILSRWVLGSGPCSSSRTTFQDRVCVESIVGNGGAFQPVHPWVGGDFNPFEGLDECPGGTSRGTPMCPCKCEPKWACEDTSGLFNYSEAMMQREFPDAEACSKQTFSQTRVMQANDDSDVCTYARSSTLPKQCLLHQGILGGLSLSHSVTADELHGHGIPTTAADFLIQGMFDIGNNGLWSGKTTLQESTLGQSYSFLKMARDTLHPGHIAFGLDSQKTGSPLIIKAIALLPYTQKSFPKISQTWIASLDEQWKIDKAIIQDLYPQLIASQQQKDIGDWSCPLRVSIFWGGGNPNFSPLVPNPLLSNLLYKNGEGVHPLIKVRSIHDNLAQYQTTNGACFYQKDDSDTNNNNRIVISLNDAQNQCGLKGMLNALNRESFSASRVVNHFTERCNDIMDTPDLDAELRSGEKMSTQQTKKCGVLHRLSPFLLTTRGNVGSVKKHQAGLTTRSEGGDCHMGRALLQSASSRENAAGRVCTLISKNSTHAVSQCPYSSSTILFNRAQPLRIKELVQKSKRTYRDEMGIPEFWGPKGIKLQEAEVSFGLLYAASLRRVLASDLIQECSISPGCSPISSEWMGLEFYSKYADGRLLNSSSPPPSATKQISDYFQGAEEDKKLWNQSDWTWSFLTFQASNATSNSTEATKTITRKAQGTVVKEKWLQNRFQACNASYHKYAYQANNMQNAVRSITLCEPAPTEGLQKFCQAMLQYRTDIANINCQVMGGKDCLYQPGMFYMPYMWSATNQEFMADTVLTYYKDIIDQNRFKNESFTQLCPSRNSLLSKLAELSRIQAKQCPGYQIEYLKDIFTSIKSVGKDILYMGYCLVMFVVNVLGSAFSDSPAAFTAMSKMATQYIAGFIDTASRVIMPLLDAMINILFGTSSAGKIMKDMMYYLCKTYNVFMEYFFVPSWCGLIRPALYVILKFLEGLVGPFDRGTAQSINAVWIAIAGGDVGLSIDDTKTCLGSIKIELQCSAPDSLERQDNISDFLVQPVATRCWVDSYSGGNVLTGSSGNSYLACTASDTCAVDPLNFDSYDSKSNLIPCISCPYIPLEEMAQRFGCNTYLKRCTCGMRSMGPSDCLTNSDCRQTTTCGVTSSIDLARQAATTMPCSICGQLGSEPVCVMDATEATGVCTCVSITQSDTLHSCNPSSAGKSISLLSATGQCLVTTNNYVLDALSPSLILEFSTLAIASCALGTSSGFCLSVKLPLSSGGQYTRYFAVLLGITSGSLTKIGGGRRLLSIASDSTVGLDPSTWNWTSSPICNKTFIQESKISYEKRIQAKWCIHWMLTANTARHNYNLTRLEDHDLISSSLISLAFNQKLAGQVLNNPDAARFIIKQYDGLFPVIVDTLLAISVDAFSLLGQAQIFSSNISNTSQNNNSTFEVPKNISVRGRKLLQVTTTMKLPIQKCTALEVPLSHVSDAFWDTVKYYESSNIVKIQNESKNLSLMDGNDVWWYVLPPQKNDQITQISHGWLADLTNNVVSMVTGGNADGTRIMDAFLSDVPYNETVSNNYITGRRLLTEVSTCNYTTLTFGSEHKRPLMPWLIFLVICFIMLTSLCSPSMMITFFAWFILFPMVLLWAVYNVSPLCWPMIPPKLPQDLASELTSIVPDSLEIPSFLVDTTCSVRGLLSDGTYDPACFKQCGQDPFLMLSWQDPAAWWLCDLISIETCTYIGKSASYWGVFQDFASSVTYYSDVIAFGSKDADFVGAHRLCAFFMSYELVFAFLLLVMAIFILPSVIQAIVEIFSGALVLLIYASSAEMADDY